MKEITIPEKLLPLIKAFSADEQAARLLIIEASKTICKSQESSKEYYFDDNKEISKEEIEGIIGLMRGIDPRDTIELIYGAQIITSHLMGLRMLSRDHHNDHIIGLKLLRFSNEAMERFQKKKIRWNLSEYKYHLQPSRIRNFTNKNRWVKYASTRGYFRGVSSMWSQMPLKKWRSMLATCNERK